MPQVAMSCSAQLGACYVLPLHPFLPYQAALPLTDFLCTQRELPAKPISAAACLCLLKRSLDTALMRPAANSQAWPTQMTDRLQQLWLLKVASEDLTPVPLRGSGALRNSSNVARLYFIVKTSSKLFSNGAYVSARLTGSP